MLRKRLELSGSSFGGLPKMNANGGDVNLKENEQ